ncbi:MAG: hypothetical protein WBG80_11245, partial [Bacteroidota bacterium]
RKTAEEIQAVKDYMNLTLTRRATRQAPVLAGGEEKGKAFSGEGLSKTAGQEDRKHYFMNGNKISTEVYNFGGIAPGYDLLRGVNNFVWRNMDYVFTFCPFMAASVPDPSDTNRLYIVSDAIWDYPNLREVNPTGDTLWTWQPLPGFADPDQEHMASNPAPDTDNDGKPDSWPRDWYNPTLGEYVWPGFLSQGVLSADQEVFWAMDDRDNAEFQYYPYPGDSTRRGLGIRIDGRAFQWSNALAENTIFFVYTVTNTSDKDLGSVVFGIYGDPDLGGGAPENKDDFGFFVPPFWVPDLDVDSLTFETIPVYSRSLVYFWDPDMTGARGLPLGYLGCKFLESPGNHVNGIDDDGDGMIDERQDDGIDNDEDWDVLLDDVGIDGVPNTGDQGEGDGFPTAGRKLPDGSLDPLFPGEPNYELTDLDESDQIGLTSFNSWVWNSDKVSNDASMWNRCIPRNFGEIQQASDIVFIFGSGYISLKKGETKRISMALICGETLDDLLVSAKTVQTIYNRNYQFFRPPNKPTMTAVPEDKKVTLYWDTFAEESIDPITGQDFEGYAIYRSTDPSFNEVQTITDGKGSQFLSTPLRDANGREAKWDVAFRDEPYTDENGNGQYDDGEPYEDVTGDGYYSFQYADVWRGYHPVPYQDRGIQYFLGNNTGLVHSFVDSNNVINGQTYYYAVISYDHGDSVGIPPTESTKKITLDPITNQLTFDDNTAQVIPGPRTSGYVNPEITSENVMQVAGIGTGSVNFTILNDLDVKDCREYEIIFSDSLFTVRETRAEKNYSVMDTSPFTETFFAYDTNFTALGHSNIANDEFLEVKDGNGTVYTRDVDYILNFLRGAIRRTGNSSMPNRQDFSITYRYYPVGQSTALDGTDSNPVFDGVLLEVLDAPELNYDPNRSGWVEGSSNLEYTARLQSVTSRKFRYPADYTVSFSAQDIDSAITFSGGIVKIAVNYSVKEVTYGVPQPILTFLNENSATRDQKWDPGEEIALFSPTATGLPTDTLTWGIVITKPADTTVTPILPTDGDVLFIGTSRPFDARDRYTLRTESGRVSADLASSSMSNIYVVPNPYVGVNELEPTFRLPGENRGERRIYFENLPMRCTIRIFSLNGDHVQTLEHDSNMENGREFWNLLNRDGFGVAYGVYMAHIEAPDIGETIIKFALIK